MAATSVTGVGPGMSNGLYKPENNSGCCGGNSAEEAAAEAPVRRGCYISNKACCSTKKSKSCCNVRIRGC